MARFTAAFLVFLLLAAPALGDPQLQQLSTEELVALRDQISLELAARSASADALASWDTSTGHIELISITRGFTDKGVPAADMLFTYTNTTDAVDNFRANNWITVYHDGVERGRPIYVNDVLLDTEAWTRKVLPGRTLQEMHWYIELPGIEDVIVVEVEDRGSRPYQSAGMRTIQLPDE